jgi:uncharacterized protein (DUF2141 family)
MIMSCVVAVMMLAPTMAWAQAEEAERFTVSGEVTFTKTGDITLRLMTAEQHKKSRDDDDSKEEKKGGIDFAADKDVTGFLIITPSEQELQQKRIPFTFKDVPKGTYAIEGYQDVNGDEVLNTNWLGMGKEPHGNTYAAADKKKETSFDKMAFDVVQDVTSIVIEMK